MPPTNSDPDQPEPYFFNPDGSPASYIQTYSLRLRLLKTIKWLIPALALIYLWLTHPSGSSDGMFFGIIALAVFLALAAIGFFKRSERIYSKEIVRKTLWVRFKESWAQLVVGGSFLGMALSAVITISVEEIKIPLADVILTGLVAVYIIVYPASRLLYRALRSIFFNDDQHETAAAVKEISHRFELARIASTNKESIATPLDNAVSWLIQKLSWLKYVFGVVVIVPLVLLIIYVMGSAVAAIPTGVAVLVAALIIASAISGR